MNPYQQSLIDMGLARVYRGRLIPIMRGGSDDDALFEPLPEDLAELSDDELAAHIAGYEARVSEIADDHTLFVTDDRSAPDLLDETSAAVDSLGTMRAEQAARAERPDVASELSDLAARALAQEPEPEEEPEPETPAEEPEPEPEPEAEAAIVAAAEPPVRPALPRPAPSRRPVAQERDTVALTAASGVVGIDLGTPFSDPMEIAEAMIRRRRQFGTVPEGVGGEQFPIARADWSSLYPDERKLSDEDALSNMALVAAALDQREIKRLFQERRRAQLERPSSLVAAGGLCAPVTPYYQLEMVSTSGRPVRAALPAFNADRGGIRYAAPATLASISTGVGTRTVANDFAGGTEAAKTCQVIACPPFTETDVEIIFHCLQFGNLGARAFPELVAQWNQLVLASQARTAESLLLTGIDAASTQVTATDISLGAVGALLPQILAAANGMRNRHRMDSEAVLRIMLPDWAIDLLVSDVIRSQFQRFDTDEAKITALLRSFDLEPTFYIDGATGKSQVFGTQTAGALLPFPSTVVWYLFPEGSFLYLDGGTLELGLVRDSVLNAGNNFQIFGESFENVAFIGVESLAVTSTICDSGAVSAPVAVTECGDYGVS